MIYGSLIKDFNVFICQYNVDGICSHIECDTDFGHIIDFYFCNVEWAQLPPNTVSPLFPDYPELSDRLLVQIYACLDRYVWHIDLLRNERTFILIDTDEPKFCELRSDISKAGWGHYD